ncbi:Uncharacterised protein g5342 [Pycnogonum litorale]
MELLQPPKFIANKAGPNLAKEWADFISEFDIYLVASGKQDGAKDDQKIALLLYAMGREYQTVFTNLTFTEGKDKKKYDDVKGAFNDYFEPRKLRKGYITLFQSRKQNANESIQEYITVLKDLASKCEYIEPNLSEQLCVALSNGVRDSKLREKLWTEFLKLDSVIRKAIQFEQQQFMRPLYDRSNPHSADIHAYSRGRSTFRGYRGRGGARSRAPSQRGRGNGTTSFDTRIQFSPRGRGRWQQRAGYNNNSDNFNNACVQCGGRHPPARCPAYGKTCRHCHKYNHFEKCCRTKNRVYENYAHINEQSDLYDYNSDQYVTADQLQYGVWQASIQRDNNGEPNNWIVKLHTPGCGYVNFKIDTGAEINAISKGCYNSMRIKPPIMYSDTIIYGFGQQTVKPVGCVKIPVAYKNKRETLRCEIIDGEVPNILCLNSSIKLNLVKRIYSGTNRKHQGPVLKNSNDIQNQQKHENIEKCTDPKIKELLYEYIDVFDGIGKIPGKVSLRYDQHATPVSHPPRGVPAPLRLPLKRKLEELVGLDILERVPDGEETPWLSSVHVLLKKDNVDVRVTIDPKNLNEALIREVFPMTTVDEVLTRVHGSKLFTVLDANSGFYQLELDDESKALTSFNTPFGRFRYKRLPMGIKSAPELFQRRMVDIFGDLPNVNIIVDDMLLDSNDTIEHYTVLRSVLQRAREKNVKFSLRKLAA